MKFPGCFAKIPSCSFCGNRAKKGQKFIEGPGVSICDACVALCAEVLPKQIKAAQEQKYVPTDLTKKREIILCSFCAKDREDVRAFFTKPGARVRICDACVALCAAALSKEPKAAPVQSREVSYSSVQLREIWCSFCGNHLEKGRRMVAGSGVYICDACVALGTEAISLELSRNPTAPKPKPASARWWQSIALCSFCGKRGSEVKALIDEPGASICDACVSLSAKLLAGKWTEAPRMKVSIRTR